VSRARFITFEGGEGAGKSTQVRRLADGLVAAGLDVTTTREPGGAPGAEEIRQLLVTGETGRWDATSEALLHFAARRTHVEETIRPALDAGQWVICDRFADSTMAYQGYGHGLGRDVIDTLYHLVLDEFGPDLTLILDVPVEDGLRRAGGRDHAENRYERMGVAFHECLRAGFIDIAEREPERCVVIDATRPADTVQDDIWAAVAARLKVDLA
jgi:dTMP kinase